MVALCLGHTADAQLTSRSPSYWQFAASGRLDSVVLSDVDADGIAEIIALDENGRLTLLTAEAWSFLQLGAQQEARSTTPFPHRWAVMFLVAVGFWNFVGAGIFGFLVNLPIVLSLIHI